MIPDGSTIFQWMSLAAPVVVAIIIAGLNIWAQSKVDEERDKARVLANEERDKRVAASLGEVRNAVGDFRAEVKTTLGNFGARLATVQEEIVRMQSVMGIGTSDGVMAELRELRRGREELQAATIRDTERIDLLAGRVSTLESHDAR